MTTTTTMAKDNNRIDVRFPKPLRHLKSRVDREARERAVPAGQIVREKLTQVYAWQDEAKETAAAR